MRYITAFLITLSLGAAASLYTPTASAATVVVAPGVVRIAPPYYWGPRVWVGASGYGPHYWGYSRFYGHPGHWGYRRW
jgi:hypothetical protein